MRNEYSNSQDKNVQENPVEHQCVLCPYSTAILGSHKSHLRAHSIEKPFKCPECPYRAKWKGNITVHLKLLHHFQSQSSRPFPCAHPGCSYAATLRSNLRKHSNIHSDKKCFVCSHPNCNYSTNQKGHIIQHTRIHTGEKPFVCQFESCSYATTTSGSLVLHTRSHTKERPFKCAQPNCEYSAAESSKLKQHQLTHEPKEGEEFPSFKCPICKYSTKWKHSLSQHIKRHTLEKLFKCDEPGCIFEARYKSEVESHKLSKHSDEKPFACSFESCEYRCKQKSSLSDHLKRHSDERQYKCELCPFRAKTKETVIKHLQGVHADPNFRPFKCTEPKCDHAFKTKGVLNKHLLIHNEEKKYACSFPLCEYRANRTCHVKSHEYNIHSEEKKEKCGICAYKCKTKTHLTTHMRTHTKQKPCKEEGCTYQARSSSNLRLH